MRIGVVVLTHAGPLLVTRFFLVTIWYLGPPKDNPLSLDLVQRQNTKVLLMLYPTPVGFAIYYLSYIVLFKELI